MNDAILNTTPSDIRFCYMIVLGREAEDENATRAFASIGLKSAIEEFVVSEEFTILRDRFSATHSLPHSALGNADIRRCSKWLSSLYGECQQSLWYDWPALVRGLLTAPALDLRHNRINEEFIARLSDESGGRIDVTPEMRQDTEFDRSWFVGSNDALSMASRNGQSTSDEDLIKYGLARGLQIFPMFSSGYDEALGLLYRDPSSTAAAIKSDLDELFYNGELGHWLFSEDYYGQAFARHSGSSPIATRPVHLTYAHYLSRGGAEGYGPHPLFSSFAYQKFHDIDRTNAYRHYLTVGIGSNLATSAVFDGEYYMAWNPTARRSIESGKHKCALHHFIDVGIHSNYRFSPDFDIGYYASEYPDAQEAVQDRSVPSLTWHFVMIGLSEGRRPNGSFDPSYYRMRYPHIVQEMKSLKIDSELEHFLLIGRAKSYKADPPIEARHPSLDEAKLVMNRKAIRSYDTIRRSPLDFSVFLDVDIGISIVVPVMNDVDFTCNFLRCAYFSASYLKQTLNVGTQVIVVSNGSTDDTVAVLKTCRGVVGLDIAAPMGFPRAVNAGARQAEGKILVVANNDIDFEPDTFVNVVERFRASPEVGIVGSLIVLPNESIQEAGSFLDSTGGVVGLGRHDRPWDAFYQGLHRADYCSGCFVSLLRADYEALGGLDEDYSPGYYEETDLSFRLKNRLGKSTYVDSTIQIVHYEHATFGKGRPIIAAYAKIKRNQALLVERHGAWLDALPSHTELSDRGHVRPHVISRSRLLVIVDLILDPRFGSSFGRADRILSALSKYGVAFDILVLDSHSQVEDYVDRRVRVYRHWMPDESLDHILASEAAKYSHVVVCQLHNLARFSDVLERSRQVHGFSVVCDTEALTPLRDLQVRRAIGIPVTEHDEAVHLRGELSLSVKVAAWLCVSDSETATLQRLGYDTVVKIPLGVARTASDAGIDGRTRILSVGSVHQADSPNYEAIVWFMDRVYDRCGPVWKDFRLTLVGYWDEALLREFRARYAGVSFDHLGVLPDHELEAVYGQSRLAIAPTRIAAGVATKVVESMARGVPIVMTTVLADQIDGYSAGSSVDMAVGRRDDDGAAFADWIVRLAGDDALWERVRAEQVTLWRANFSPDVFDRCMEEMMDRADIKRRR